MAIWLQVVLAVVVLLLCGFLVPLLLQLRRTAAAVQLLAESAREDLRTITADVHHIRERADGLADLASASLELPIGIGRVLSGTARTLSSFLESDGSSWLSALLTGLRFAMNLFRRPRRTASKEAAK
jgi:hypothetical protein